MFLFCVFCIICVCVCFNLALSVGALGLSVLSSVGGHQHDEEETDGGAAGGGEGKVSHVLLPFIICTLSYHTSSFPVLLCKLRFSPRLYLYHTSCAQQGTFFFVFHPLFCVVVGAGQLTWLVSARVGA